MEQLLRINMTPGLIGLSTHNARLIYDSPKPGVDISRQQGGLEINSDFIKVHIDSSKMRESIGLISNKTLTQNFADKGEKLYQQGVSKTVNEGNSLADPHGMKIPDIAAVSNKKSVETVLAFLPKDRPEISWSGGDISINYETDKLNMEWDTQTWMNFDYVQGKVEVGIIQKPRVDVEYIGGPLYIPPSGDPNYSGKNIDIKV